MRVAAWFVNSHQNWKGMYFSGMEGIDPFFVGTLMTMVTGISCSIVAFSGYRNFALTIMGSETKANYHQVRQWLFFQDSWNNSMDLRNLIEWQLNCKYLGSVDWSNVNLNPVENANPPIFRGKKIFNVVWTTTVAQTLLKSISVMTITAIKLKTWQIIDTGWECSKLNMKTLIEQRRLPKKPVLAEMML